MKTVDFTYLKSEEKKIKENLRFSKSALIVK